MRLHLALGLSLGAMTTLACPAAAPEPAPADPCWTVPVLVIQFFPPAADRSKIDVAETSNVGAPVKEVREKCARMTREVIEALEQGSRYHAYKDPKARRSLHYVVVDSKEYLEPMPRSPKVYDGARLPDYDAILKRAAIEDYVKTKGVKEVWIWGYHSKTLRPWESNMSSPAGDVSNSDRDPRDLPVFDRTYTVYHYNYQRETSEAVHNHIHQIEAIMRARGGKLWEAFEGRKGAWRCGNCHFPPNGRRDYDWANKDYIDSDIEDWKPEGFGHKERLNCEKWGGDSLRWFVYWMQSIPGEGNKLTFQGQPLTNWWVYLGDYDYARNNKVGLVAGGGTGP
jgi:hypothetical protein